MSEVSPEVGETAQAAGLQGAASVKEPVHVVAQLGVAAYEKAAQDYIIALEQTSRAKAKLKNSNVIVPYHVQLAVDFLSSGKKGWVARVSDVGVLLIGAGLGYLGNMIFGSSYTVRNSIFSFVPLLLGCMAYAYAWGRRND
jgi:hypothetical protein